MKYQGLCQNVEESKHGRQFRYRTRNFYFQLDNLFNNHELNIKETRKKSIHFKFLEIKALEIYDIVLFKHVTIVSMIAVRGLK